MKRYDLVVVGAGPAGLSAALEAAKSGMHTIVFDENARPGGQLFKQIHKFFGSKEHKAKERGYKIGQELLAGAQEAGVQVELNATVMGIYGQNELTVRIGQEVKHVRADNILAATGASEKMVNFEGWTKPGVIGAGAAQTLMNLHHVRPGQRILMLGTGNVGLVVAYQLLQAGCKVVAMVDALPRVGGYGVHASKLARCGVPFYLSHTIVKAEGDEEVTGVTIAQVGPGWKLISGTEKHFDVDTICLAVGLTPMSQLLAQAGCEMQDGPGGLVPKCGPEGETSLPGVYAAGDVSGIEEASSAMIEGRICGNAITRNAGYRSAEEAADCRAALEQSLDRLRQGMFAPKNRGKALTVTEEGVALSQSLLQHGFISQEEIERYPGVTHATGIHPVIECSQNIPCNPCQDACKFGCICIGSQITSLPSVNPEKTCMNCGACVACCPGQAIFLVNERASETEATITLPYEFLPLPSVGEHGIALDRSGQEVCPAVVEQVRRAPAFDSTVLLTIRVPKEMAMRARFFKKEG